MKLWVDDIRPAPDESWTVAKTVNSAIKAIHAFQFEEISLDHDISHQVTIGELGRPYPCNETFQAVAYYIAEQWRDKTIGRPKITIHTSNPGGAKEMELILKEVDIIPEIKMMGLSNRLEQEQP